MENCLAASSIELAAGFLFYYADIQTVTWFDGNEAQPKPNGGN